jgi:hypothetical protein
MKCRYSTEAYQWHDGNQHHVGVMVKHQWGPVSISPDNELLVLMSHSHTRELEFVKYSDLKPYPASPIPQP